MLSSLFGAPPIFSLQKRRTADAYPVAVLFDDFRNVVNDASLNGRAPLVRPNSNNWIATNSFVGNAGKAEARFPSASNSLLRVDIGQTAIDMSMDFILPTTGSNRSAGILFRYVSSNTYLFTLANFNNAVFRINALNGGATLVLEEVAFNFLASTPYHMRLVCVGNQIFSTIDGIGTLHVDLEEYDAANLTTLASTFAASTVHGIRGANTTGQGAVIFDKVHCVPPPDEADVYITVNPVSTYTSQMETAISHINNNDFRFANATARARAMPLLAEAFDIQHQPMLGYGSSDPWRWLGDGTRPSEPTNWGSLDTMIDYFDQMGSRKMITTDLIPWHIKGIYGAGGVTTPGTLADQFTDSGRVMTSKQGDWVHLIRRLAERYLPLGVTIWQTGIEFHGDQRNHIDFGFDPWAYDDYPGTSGNNADAGAAHLHNLTVDTIKQVASELNIPLESLDFINNYPRLRATTGTNSDSFPVDHPLRERPWGTGERMGFEAIIGMVPLIEHNITAWAVDFSLSNIDTPIEIEAFAALEKFTDYIEYIKDELAALDITDKKIVVSELYDNPPANEHSGNPQYRAALRAESMRRLLEAGVWLAMGWGISGRDADDGYEDVAGFLTPLDTADGGEAYPKLGVVKTFKENYSRGTDMHTVTVVGDGVSAIANANVITLINKTPLTKKAMVGTTVHTLVPFDVKTVGH